MDRRFIQTRDGIAPSSEGGFADPSEPDRFSTQRIPTLKSLSKSLGEERDLGAVLDHALDWVLKLSGADAGAIFTVDHRTQTMTLSSSSGFGEVARMEFDRVSFRDGLFGVVANSGSPILLEDLPGNLPVVTSDSMRSYAGVPLYSGAKLVGVLAVFSHTADAFSAADAELLQNIGNQIALAIDENRPPSSEVETREQMGRKMSQLSELIRVSSAFRASAPLDEVLKAICSAISTTLGFRLVELNLVDEGSGKMIPSAFAGFTPEEEDRIRQTSRPVEFYARVMHPRYRMSNSYFIPYQDSPYSEDEWAFLPEVDDSERAEDEWHRNDALAVPLHNRDGHLIGMLYVDDPISRKRPSVEQVQMLEMFVQQSALAIENAKLVEELRKSEGQYRLLTENATDLIFLLDPNGTVSFMSSSAKRVLGYDPAELVGKKFSDMLSPTSRRLSPNYLLNPDMTQELQGRCEVEFIRSDESSAFLEINSTPIFENSRLTGELGIARDITEKKRMEREIARRQRQLRRSQKRQEQLTGYAATVIAAQEDERRRIARDLHDDTAQALIALSRQIEALKEDIRSSPEVASRKLDELKSLTDQTLASVRQFSRDLRPSLLDDLGLVPALEWLVSENAKRYKLTTRLKVSGDERRLPTEVELTCFRIAQESLNNVSKHARATGAAVEIVFGAKWFRLTVSDNGQGFESPPALSDLADRGRMGVMGMHERASLLGGTLTVRTAPGQGTRISVTIPLSDDS